MWLNSWNTLHIQQMAAITHLTFQGSPSAITTHLTAPSHYFSLPRVLSVSVAAGGPGPPTGPTQFWCRAVSHAPKDSEPSNICTSPVLSGYAQQTEKKIFDNVIDVL